MSTAALLDRFALRYAAGARALVGMLMAVAAPFADPPVGPGVCGAVAVALFGWSAAYLFLMRTRPQTWVWVVDIAVMCALCLAQSLLVDPALLLRMLGWVSPVASVAVVALQWHVRPLPGAVAAAAVCVAFVVGAAVAPEVTVGQALGVGGLWTAVEAGLSRLVRRLVDRGGEVADERMARRFAAEREAELARARRAEQRAHWATVHDTAASTLLMVGLGGVAGREPWLREQVARDVAALDGVPVAAGCLQDVVRRAVGGARIRVDLDVDGDLWLPAEAAGALGGALAEGLENVARHAGTGHAQVTAVVDEGRAHVTVRDAGRGFDPTRVPAGRIGLALSVAERMAGAGGRAVVRSRPGKGTEVRLEWPR
ncbi:ATP-binding protein [Pseudonocardia sp. RS11V-5]|uniref:sensor histidine kinase n=1 Tax=Pseudonocardia terrae TaxID=2905831 RepID=UPI001E4B38E7|nr:ATP-binding protein [Pseudonocardia terrae]MCE3551260.1 ATP-binding protein [Pseudonocardia terrae]